MAKERAPRDELTGVALLIRPRWSVEEAMKRRPASAGVLFDDHHPNFNRTSKHLRGVGGSAVRHDRVQRTSRIGHDIFHNELFDPPLLPITPEEQFEDAVFCTADYIPPVGVDVMAPNPGLWRFAYDEIRRLRESGEVRVEKSSKVRSFMVDFLLSRELQDAKRYKKLIDDFLLCPTATSYDRQRRADMARELLALIAREPAADIAQGYAYGFSNNLLSSEAPADPVDHILGQVVPDNIYQMNPLLARLQAKLADCHIGLLQGA